MDKTMEKLVHDIRGSMQACVSLINHVTTCVENGNVDDINMLKRHCDLATTSVKRVFSLLNETEEGLISNNIESKSQDSRV